MSDQPSEPVSLQDRYGAGTRCFGCGPANDKGLRIKSYPDGDDVVLDWQAERHHEAFDGFVNGGIVGTLFDCHCNWAAMWHLLQRDGSDTPPFTVTSEFHVKLKRPTPSTQPLRIRARVVESGSDRATVEAEMESGGKLTATCRGVFVAVKQGHPAYQRW